jgi:hypothetical protein
VTHPATVADTAAPWIIIVHGDLLPQRVVMADFHENSQLMGTIDLSSLTDSAEVQQRPYLSLAMFWGPNWARYPRTPEALARLRPDQGNQHGRFYPAHGGLDPLVMIGPTMGRAYTTLGPISDEGLAVLEGYEVPIHMD